MLDFLEVVGKVCPACSWVTALRQQANRYFQEENAAYRFVGEEITEITDSTEMSATESGLTLNVKSAREHLATALHIISDVGESAESFELAVCPAHFQAHVPPVYVALFSQSIHQGLNE